MIQMQIPLLYSVTIIYINICICKYIQSIYTLSLSVWVSVRLYPIGSKIESISELFCFCFTMYKEKMLTGKATL